MWKRNSRRIKTLASKKICGAIALSSEFVMTRNKHIDTNPKFQAVVLAAQLLPGTLAHALQNLLTAAINLSPFDARYKNDATGAPAYCRRRCCRWCSSPTRAGL